MADIYFDNDLGDIRIQGGDIVLTSDYSYLETMKQRIRAALLTFYGEWFLDNPDNPTVGVPYFQSLFSDKIPTINLADSIFRTALIKIEGVTSVDELTFDYDKTTRNLEVTFRVQIFDNGDYIEDVIDFGSLLPAS
jgi:hypothetical protein